MTLVLFESNQNVSNAAATVYLKPEREIIVRNNEVRMSDLFFNVTPNDDRVVASAPRFGSKLMFRFRDLETFIRKSKLSWQPRSNRGSRIVTRASRQLHPDIIHDLLAKELSSRILNYEVEIELFNTKKRKVCYFLILHTMYFIAIIENTANIICKNNNDFRLTLKKYCP